jgi:hypothetical protein
MISFAQEEIPSDLVLDKPEILEIDNVTKAVFTIEQYGIILQMYTAYQLYIDNRMEIADVIYMYEEELDKCEGRNEAKDEAIWALVDDRKFIYDTWEKSREEYEVNLRKSRIKTIFIASGSGLAGVGLGMLIYFLAAR